MELSQCLNIFGIILEIGGFIILIKSTRTLMQIGGAGLFDIKDPLRREKTGRGPDVLGTNNSKLYKISIVLVIIGLALQLLALVVK
jgi:hypothetical protein